MTDNSPTLKDIYEAVDGLRTDISKNYVSKDAFEPVRNIVYGLVAIVLISVITGVIALVVHTANAAPTAVVTTGGK